MKRNTYQKTLITQAVSASNCHPTAYDIFCEIREKAPKISLKTVYRNLNELDEEGVILRIPVPKSADRYDKTLENHAHSLCTVCGRFEDFFDESAIEYITKTLDESRQFQLDAGKLVFKGICKECKNNKIKGE